MQMMSFHLLSPPYMVKLKTTQKHPTVSCSVYCQASWANFCRKSFNVLFPVLSSMLENSFWSMSTLFCSIISSSGATIQVVNSMSAFEPSRSPLRIIGTRYAVVGEIRHINLMGTGSGYKTAVIRQRFAAVTKQNYFDRMLFLDMYWLITWTLYLFLHL